MLLVMSFDHFVTIYQPQRFSVIITGQHWSEKAWLSFSRDLWPLFLLKAFPYCGPHVLSHFFCLRQEVMHVAYTDTSSNNLYGRPWWCLLWCWAWCSLHCPMESSSTQWQDWPPERSCAEPSTHVPHTYVLHWYSLCLWWCCTWSKVLGSIPHLPSIFLWPMSISVPPMLNPIIDSIKTKEICHAISKFLDLKNTNAEFWG